MLQPTMHPNELIAFLKIMIPAREPVLIKGPPGGGKTSIIESVTSALEYDLILSHPVVEDPTNYKGMPSVIDGKAEWLPFGDLNRMIEATRPTVAFLDDLGQAPACVQAACMQLLLARRIGEHKVSDHVTFIAATNRREDKAGVTTILEPVKSRFTTIIELETSGDDWDTWALAHNMPPVLVAFRRFVPTLLSDPGAVTNDIVNRPSPRTLAAVGRMLNLGIKTLAPLAGTLGVGRAIELIGFLKIWEQLPSFDAILLSPDTTPVPTEPAALFAVATGLAMRGTSANAGRVITYARRMAKEYQVFCIRDLLRKEPKAANCKAFIEWASANQDVLV